MSMPCRGYTRERDTGTLLRNSFSIRTCVVLSSVAKRCLNGKDNATNLPLALAASSLFRAVATPRARRALDAPASQM